MSFSRLRGDIWRARGGHHSAGCCRRPGDRFRAEALGFRTVFHLTYANCLAALAASAGMLNALWLRYAGPDTS
jgi:hypothetical protein